MATIQNLMGTYLTKDEAASLYQHILKFAPPLTQPTPFNLSIELSNYATQSYVTAAINN